LKRGGGGFPAFEKPAQANGTGATSTRTQNTSTLANARAEQLNAEVMDLFRA
jgi:hypothetical protein